MPEAIEVGVATPGAHPDAGPVDPMNRNTEQMKKLAAIVAKHDVHMSDVVDNLEKNISALRELEAVVQARTEALVGRLEALTDTLSAQFDKLSAAIENNTAAVKALKRI